MNLNEPVLDQVEVGDRLADLVTQALGQTLGFVLLLAFSGGGRDNDGHGDSMRRKRAHCTASSCHALRRDGR